MRRWVGDPSEKPGRGSGRWWCRVCGRRTRRALFRRAFKFWVVRVWLADWRGDSRGVKISENAGAALHRSAAVRMLRVCAARRGLVACSQRRHSDV